jgi:hypothetical protein
MTREGTEWFASGSGSGVEYESGEARVDVKGSSSGPSGCIRASLSPLVPSSDETTMGVTVVIDFVIARKSLTECNDVRNPSTHIRLSAAFCQYGYPS